MKKSALLGLLLIPILLLSCSKTEMIYAPIEVDDRVDAEPISGLFQKNMLIEDYTGTWCGNCTRVSEAIERVKEQTDRSVTIAIHNGLDPYHFAAIGPLQDLVSPGRDLELPISRLNRTIVWTSPEPDHVQQAVNLTSNNCGLGLAMKSIVADGNIELDVNIKFAQNYENVKLVVCLLENHLLYRQTNYFSAYGPVPYIQGFEHNHVLRASLTPLLGEGLSGTNFNQTVSKRFSVPVPANVSNLENISFVAFVVDSNNTVINVREAEINQEQVFEQNP
ncbi:Omp28-related outer membrane protein [Flavobacterium sp. CYK-4]|uniref:Omp28-related outer membrane protein n=1 Tax=Flavobacterium lotistagni TaxID=2709660 RepID=UPI0014074103|nr:Omp28-related outer membrane protein [Flavobacterium lotistagni]NHM05953.1 Omp28-related outer membrane protein [Flavobacterium lotistagni]